MDGNRRDPESTALDADEALPALVAYAVLVQPQRVIHRRVESFEILDDRVVRRSVSLDFTIPREIPDFGVLTDDVLERVPYTALTLLEKGLKVNFSIRDQDDRPMSALTKAENGCVAANALIVHAETVLESACPTSIEDAIRRLTVGAPDVANAAVERSWPCLAADASSPDAAAWAALVRDEEFMSFARATARNYMLLIATPPVPSKRSIIKFSYEEPYAEDRDLSTWQRGAVRFGWRHKTVILEAPAVSTAGSFHLEAVAPPDLEIMAARMRFKRRSPEPQTARLDLPAESFDGPNVQRAHLAIEQVDPQFVAEALLHLRARRAGFIHASLMTALGVFVLLLMAWLRMPHVDPSGETAILVVPPVVAAAFLLRPGEHGLATSMLVGARALVVCVVAAALGGANLLTVGLRPSTLRIAWLGPLWLAAVALLGLLASVILPRPKEMTGATELNASKSASPSGRPSNLSRRRFFRGSR